MECFTESDKLETLTKLIESKVNIVLYGGGNNGKSYILEQLRDLITKNDYIVRDEDSSVQQLFTWSPFAARENKHVIVHTNQLANKKADFVYVKFVGVYDKISGSYIHT